MNPSLTAAAPAVRPADEVALDRVERLLDVAAVRRFDATYDTLGNVETVSRDSGDGRSRLVTYAYDAFGRRSVKVASKGATKVQCIAALAAMKGVTVPVLKEALQKKTKDEQAAILAHPSVLAKVAEMSLILSQLSKVYS